MRPRGNLVLLEVDAEDRHVGSLKLLTAPDLNCLRYCRRCGVMMEALAAAPGCAVEEEWQRNPVNDRMHLTDIQRRHDIVYEPFPIVVEKTRCATVLAIGQSVTDPEISIGARVLIDQEAGTHVFGLPYRLVPAEAILATVSE